MASSPENRTKSMRPPVGEPAASDVREADGQPEGDWQVQNRQHLGVAVRAEGKDVGEHGAATKGSASQRPLATPDPRFHTK